MKRSLFILALYSLLSSCFGELFGQSVFEDYSTSITTLDAAPYASLSLDAMDYNPAGNVFLRKGFEMSLSSLWPRWQTKVDENGNTFNVRTYKVSRACQDSIKRNVPNPSARISYRWGDNALAFSYAHGESRFVGNGNTYFDELLQREMNDEINQKLVNLSDSYNNQNTYAYLISTIVSSLYHVGVPDPPYENGTEFPLALLSSSTQYGFVSDKFSLGYSRKINIGDDDRWEYISIYGGAKVQRMELNSKTEIGLFVIEQDGESFYPLTDYYKKYSRFYYQLADSVSALSDYFVTQGDSYMNSYYFVDTAFKNLGSNYPVNKWGINAELGFNYVRPYWNVAAKMELGYLPFRLKKYVLPFGFSLGYSQFVGQFQFSLGGEFGIASKRFGLCSELFGQHMDINSINKRLYGNAGFEAAWSVPRCHLLLKSGFVFGFNKDVLLNYGNSRLDWTILPKKHNTTAFSCGFQWEESSLLTVVGGFRVLVPIDKEGFYNNVYDAMYTVNPEYQLSIGLVAHLE